MVVEYKNLLGRIECFLLPMEIYSEYVSVRFLPFD